MYEMLTGTRPFKATSLAKLLHKVVFATPEPIHKIREDVGDDIEEIVTRALLKTPEERFANGLDFAANLTRVHQRLRSQEADYDEREHFDILRGLRFFHDFSHGEIRELMRAGEWRTYGADQEVVKEGELDDRFYIIVSGTVEVRSGGRAVGGMTAGECFGETSYVTDAARAASIVARDDVILLRLSSTLLETLSTSCQLRFNRVFLRSLISRLQGGGPPAD
jgi:hypothetical protein